MDERFQLLVASVKDYAIFVLDPAGIITTWNSGAERIKGYQANEIIGQHFSRFYSDEEVRAGKCEMELENATAEGRFEDEGWRIRKDGSRFWANVIITCLRDARGDVVGFAKVTRDLTERKAAEEARLRLAEATAAREEAERALDQLSRLQELTGLLAAASTPDELVSIVVEVGAQALRAVGASFAVSDGEHVRLVAVTGMPHDVLESFRSTPLDATIPPVAVFRSRRSEWVETPEEYAERYPDALPVMPAPGASCALPLLLGDRVVGAITFRFPEPRAFTVVQRVFMETFASQVAQAFARTEIHARELEGKRRLEALSSLAEALSSALTTSDVAEAVVERGRRAANADTCTLYGLDEATRILDLIAERGCNPGVLAHIRRIGPASGNPTYSAITSGKATWVQNDREYKALFPSLANERVPGSRAQAFWAVPLVAEGAPIGLLGMGFHGPRTFPREERDFVETLARYCSEALLRARRLEAERSARAVAEMLQASLATTLRSIGDAVIATDAEGRITITNPVADELTGWPEAEARGQPLDEVFRIFNEHTREPVVSPVAKVLELGNVVGLANHTVLVHRDGKRETPIDDSGAPIRGPSGATEGVVLVFRDVTEKKRDETRRFLLEEATAALSESLDYEVTLAKVARLAVPRLADWCAIDVAVEGRDGPHRLAVAHVDEAKVRYAQELIERYPPDPNATTGVPNVLRTGKSELYPVITDDLIRAGAVDEEHLRISLSLQLRSAMVVPLVARGRAVGTMTFVWAESGHSYTKDDLAFAEELARRCGVAIENARLYAAEQHARNNADVANRAKDEFLAMVSHELRTPLNAIMGWAKLMSSAALDETKRARAIETIDRNAVAMAQLIEDLLDISRIISGKMRLEVQLVDLTRVVEAAIESVRPAAEAKAIRVAHTSGASIPPLVGDPTRLQQVVWNLLSNAVKFTPKSGAIIVDVAREESGIVVRVTDTGKGIAQDFLPHVFDPFRQQDASHTRSRGGLGLGLAITRQLVELHGGHVEAHSEGAGRGATFVVHLPLTAVSRALEQQHPETRQIRLESSFERPKQLRGIRVLVVDDEEDARHLVKAILDECGCVVTLAGSATDAMKLLQQEVPDLLISDIGMPQQDGYDLIRQVRALPAASTANLPAAALTAYARAEDRRRVLDAGYSMHIPKPVEPAELIAVVLSLTRFVQRRAENGDA
ncbi:MAG: GAF domain-containing protein [Labilithrix sp.]|nr:GAF domain-containing protein [Labilithrix sp.]